LPPIPSSVCVLQWSLPPTPAFLICSPFKHAETIALVYECGGFPPPPLLTRGSPQTLPPFFPPSPKSTCHRNHTIAPFLNRESRGFPALHLHFLQLGAMHLPFPPSSYSPYHFLVSIRSYGQLSSLCNMFCQPTLVCRMGLCVQQPFRRYALLSLLPFNNFPSRDLCL